MDNYNSTLIFLFINIFISISFIITFIIFSIKMIDTKLEIIRSIDVTNNMKSKLSDIFRLSHDIIGYSREIDKAINYRNNRKPYNNRYRDNRDNYNRPQYNNSNRSRFNDQDRVNHRDGPRYNKPRENDEDVIDIEKEIKNKEINSVVSSRIDTEKESNYENLDKYYNVNDGDFINDINEER